MIITQILLRICRLDPLMLTSDLFLVSLPRRSLVEASKQNWEQGRRLNPLFNIMSVASYHILYPAINSYSIDFPTSTAYDLVKHIYICVSFYRVRFPPLHYPPRFHLSPTMLVLFWRRELRTVGSSKGCFLLTYVL